MLDIFGGLYMARFESKPLAWLDQLAALRAYLQTNPTATREERKEALKLGDSQLTGFLAIDACFDPAAEEKVRQAANGVLPSTSNVLGQSNPVTPLLGTGQIEASQQMPYVLSYRSAEALAGLKDKITDLPAVFPSALDVTLSRHLATQQIKALVKWIKAGHPAETFNEDGPSGKGKGTKEKSKDKSKTSGDLSQTPPQGDIFDKLVQAAKKLALEEAAGNISSASRKELNDCLQKIREQAKDDESKEKTEKKKKGKDAQKDSNWVETVYLSWLADVSLIKKIKSKVGKGQSVTRGEKALLWLHKLSEWADWVVKHLFKLLKPILKLAKIIWKLLMEALEVLGLLKYIKAVLVVAAFVCFGWIAWEAWRYGPMHPFRILEPYCFRKTEESPVEEVPTPVAPQAVGSSELEVRSSNLKPKTTNSKLLTANSPPTAVYQPSIAWQSSDEDPKVLETEMAALPVNCIVKDFPLTPDEGMPGDLAVSRLQDLTNPDKYTMKIGKDTQRILSVNPTTTNLIINYKSTDPLVFDSSGPMNFFWEDVIMIHVDEVDVEGKNPKVIYQCSLIVSGAKEPLTIQCSTPADLKHLVSTMEYFIRASRLAHDTALAGMPYPSQGLRLNNQCLVEVLWANSPMANAVSDMETAQPNHVAQLGASQQVKAGVKLGDMVWSVDQNASLPPERKNLEAQLGALTAGSHDLFLASPTDREKGLVQMNQTHTTYFNPKRRKVILTVS